MFLTPFSCDFFELLVPEKFEPTRSDRGWIIDPFAKNHPWTYFAALLPALLATILIFMDQQITAVIINRKEHKLKVTLIYVIVILRAVSRLKMSFTERLWISFGPVYTGNISDGLFRVGNPLVRGCYSPLHEPRQFSQNGVRMRSSWRETQISRCKRAESYPHPHICPHWLVRDTDISSEAYSDAGPIRGFPVHGLCLTKRNAILRSNSHYAHAYKVPTRSHVSTTSTKTSQVV